MAGNSPVLEDGSTLSRLDKTFLKIERIFALISGFAVFSLMVMAVVSVGGRNMFNRPLPGYVDWVEAAMPLIAFMGIAYAQRDGTHIRMDILIGRLKGRALWFAELVSVLLILLLMVALVWGSWAHFERSFDWNAPLWSRDSSIDIGLPLWPAKILAPIAFSILCVRLVIQIWGFGRALVLGLEQPVAVPLIQDAAAQAMAEAEQLGKKG
ncbi:TRAP transporter small permease [Aestuariivita sp.]|jgi:TRAP-type C4-dicarboxylate transport system permease small subunit|uniref:TRAP transporter small permease n=1 Tax=Aestuariivita sp. TaxID=1872407 RepID=UPI00216F261A|nr:TRAP transporter small permease [Aestuariivita sp.]MCE8009488.1 TRAP transporter small permease [Aestuariivita sp.]